MIPWRPGEQVLLSPDLEQLWFHEQLCAFVPVNNESVTIHKRGPLDALALERCFNEIARRHEIWRSAFPMSEGKVVQRIDSYIRIPAVDRSQPSSRGRREAEAARIATEDVRRPFDLNVAPLFRARLVRCAEDYHRIYLTLHHLVYDCVSIDHVLITELAALYTRIPPASPLLFLSSPSNTRLLRVEAPPVAPAAIASPKWNTGARPFRRICRRWSCPRTSRVPRCPLGGAKWRLVQIPAPVIEALKELGTERGRNALHDSSRRVPGFAISLFRTPKKSS